MASAEITIDVTVQGVPRIRREFLLSQIQLLEWVLTLRHRYTTASSCVDTKRGVPVQIKQDITTKIAVLKTELQELHDQLAREPKETT